MVGTTSLPLEQSGNEVVEIEEHFAILEALKRLFRHFRQHSVHIAA